jgi:hypothetical protein
MSNLRSGRRPAGFCRSSLVWQTTSPEREEMLTGPYFLLLAGAALLYGIGLLPLIVNPFLVARLGLGLISSEPDADGCWLITFGDWGELSRLTSNLVSTPPS